MNAMFRDALLGPGRFARLNGHGTIKADETAVLCKCGWRKRLFRYPTAAELIAVYDEHIREAMIDNAVRYVEYCYPRTMRLLLEGHSAGEPLGGADCIACTHNVTAIRTVFRDRCNCHICRGET